MKILQINPYPPDHFGGSEIFCKNLALNLNKRKKIKSDILTSDIFKRKKKKEYFKDINTTVYYQKFFFNLLGKNPVVNIFNFLKKHYNDYDIIHMHSYFFFTSIQCALFKKVQKFPLVLNLHGGIETPLLLGENLFQKMQLMYKKEFFDKLIGKLPIKYSDAIISVTRRDLSIVKEKYLVDKKPCFFIPNGVDINRFKLNNYGEKNYITFIGRLSYIKGIDIFLEIINKLYKKNRNLKFLIIGDGPLRKKVIEAKSKLPIKYFPFYPYNKIDEIYNLSKVILITSRFEGLPTTLLESLACETPVIASNVGGISEVISDNYNGILFNFNNYQNVAVKILDLINNENLLQNYGKNGRNLITKKYTWDIITNQILDVYNSVLK